MKKKLSLLLIVFLFIIGISVSSNASNNIGELKQIEANLHREEYNPLYKKEVTQNISTSKKRAITKKANLDSINPTDNYDYYVDDKTKTAKTIRDNAVARKESFVIYVKIISQQEVNNFDIFGDYIGDAVSESMSMEIASSSSDGDYLKWSWISYGIDDTSTWHGEQDGKHLYFLNIMLNFKYFTTYEQERTVDEEVSRFINLHIDNNASKFEKICEVYDYITSNIVYDYENLEDNNYLLKYTAYAAIHNKTAVCQGYSTLLYKILCELGIKDVRVITSIEHAWNAIKMGSYYYDVDSTWDSEYNGNGINGWKFFLKGTNYFNSLQYHIMEDDYLTNDFKNKYPLSTSNYSLANVSYASKSFKLNIKDASINEIQSTYKYENKDIMPKVYLKYKNYNLIEGVDYRIEYKNNKNIGEATIEINGIGYFWGSITKKFNIIHTASDSYHNWDKGAIIRNATCTANGETTYKCLICGKTKTEVIPATGHKWNAGLITKNATYDEYGEKIYTCYNCNEQVSEKINKLAKNNISKVSITGIADKTYNGKQQIQFITVMYGKTKLQNLVDYIVTYSNNKKVGKATIIITGKGKYTGVVKKTFKINPKGTKLAKLEKGKKQIKVKWNKQKTETKGYQIQYSTNKKFKSGNKTVTINKNKTTSLKVTKLKANKRYYVRVRTFKIVNNKKYYSGWSNVKNVVTKK